jgi:hypothetical protein
MLRIACPSYILSVVTLYEKDSHVFKKEAASQLLLEEGTTSVRKLTSFFISLLVDVKDMKSFSDHRNERVNKTLEIIFVLSVAVDSPSCAFGDYSFRREPWARPFS